jgi:hypothetical protein
MTFKKFKFQITKFKNNYPFLTFQSAFELDLFDFRLY